MRIFSLTVRSGPNRASGPNAKARRYLIGRHVCRSGADGHVIVVVQRPLLASHLRDCVPAVSARSSAQRPSLSGDCPDPALV